MQEILEDCDAVFRQDRFRVKLDAPERPGRVADCHHGAIGGPGDFSKGRGQRLHHSQRMIADCFERRGNAAEELVAIVFDSAHLAVGWFDARESAAECERNPLIAEANSEDWYGGTPDYVGGDAEVTRIFGTARTGRNYDGVKVL